MPRTEETNARIREEQKERILYWPVAKVSWNVVTLRVVPWFTCGRNPPWPVRNVLSLSWAVIIQPLGSAAFVCQAFA